MADGNALDRHHPSQLLGHDVAQFDATFGVLEMVAEVQQIRLLRLATGTLGDIGEGADRALQHAVAIQRRDPVFDRQAAAVLSEEQFVIDMGRFARPGGTLDRAVFDGIGRAVRVAVVDDVVQLAPEHLLLAGKAEQPDECLVAQRDAALGIDGVEAFAGRIQQASGERLAFESLGFGAAPLMYVLGHQYPVQQATVTVVDRSATALEPARGTVGGEQGHFETAGLAAFQCRAPLLQHRVPVIRRDGLEPAPASRFVGRHPGEVAPVAVAEDQRAAGIALPDHLRAEIHQRAVAHLRLANRRRVAWRTVESVFARVATQLEQRHDLTGQRL